ncbi:GntR family transcriptional regulator [Nocardia tengchongensis]
MGLSDFGTIGEVDRSLSAQVFTLLRDRIVEGVLEPGSRINERELAEELGVSRNPIREALPRLENEGFVVIVPRRGAVVTELTYRDVEELFAVRRSLEVLAATDAAAAVAGGRSPQRLLTAVEVAEHALAQREDAALAAANAALHEQIVQLSGNSLLISIMPPIAGRIRRLFRLEAERDQAVLCAEHRALCAAIAAGDQRLAADLAAAHVDHSRVESLALLRTRLA